MRKYYRLIGIIILFVILSKIDLKKISEQLSGLNLLQFALVNLLTIPGIFIKAYRWKFILRFQNIDYPIRQSFFSYLGGIFAGIVTPGRVGETIKAIYLKEEKGMLYVEALAGIFVDRFLDLYLLCILGATGIFYFFKIENIKSVIPLVSVLVFLIPGTLFLLNSKLLEKSGRAVYNFAILRIDKNIFASQSRTFFKAVQEISRHKLYVPMLLTVLAYILYFWQSYLLARIASIDIGLPLIVSLVSVSTVISLLPITILGIGTREAGLVYLFSLIGLSAESAVAYSFLLFFSSYAVCGLFAYIGWLVKGKSKSVTYGDVRA